MVNIRRIHESEYFKNLLLNNIILRFWEPIQSYISREPIQGSVLYLLKIGSYFNGRRPYGAQITIVVFLEYCQRDKPQVNCVYTRFLTSMTYFHIIFDISYSISRFPHTSSTSTVLPRISKYYVKVY